MTYDEIIKRLEEIQNNRISPTYDDALPEIWDLIEDLKKARTKDAEDINDLKETIIEVQKLIDAL